MRSSRIIFCVTLFLATPALAQAAPATPTLSTTSGLTATSSKSPIGFVPPTPATLHDYVDAIGGVEVAASFQASKKETAGLVHLANGASVSFQASYTKQNGATTATLDGISLVTSGVGLGPLGLVHVQSAQVNGDGSMSVQLNSWLPKISIKSVVHEKNGDTEFMGGSWWMPNIIVAANGDVKLSNRLGTIKVGSIDPKFFPNWPPSLEDLSKLAMSLTGAKGSSPPPLPPSVTQLAGNLSWDVKANANGLPITVDGAPIKASENAEVKGLGTLANGVIQSTPAGNTVHVALSVPPQELGSSSAGLDLTKGTATVDGTYKMTIPLQDPEHGIVFNFNGQASYDAQGQNLRVTMPNGGQVSVAQLDLSRSGAVQLGVNGDAMTFNLDDANYAFDAKGPITITKLGPISSLALDGELTSKGVAKISSTGLFTLQGNLNGGLQETSTGFLPLITGDKAWTKAGIEPGSQVTIALDQFTGALQLPVDGKSLAVTGASGSGNVGVHAVLGDLGAGDGGVQATAPSAVADLQVAGSGAFARTFTGSGNVTGDVNLPQGGAVQVSSPLGSVKANVDPGTRLDVKGTVAAVASGDTPALTITNGEVSSQLGASNIAFVSSAIGSSLGITLPNATVNLDAKGNLDTRSGATSVASLTGIANVASGGAFANSLPTGKVTGTIDPGAQLTLNANASSTNGTTTVSGALTGSLGAAANAQLKNAKATANVSGTAQATVNAPFSVKVDPDGTAVADPSKTQANVPVTIQLKEGSTLVFSGKTVKVADTSSYITLTGHVGIDSSGKPALQSLQNVNIEVGLGQATLKLLGIFNVTVPVKKTQIKGNVTFSGSTMHVQMSGDTNVFGIFTPSIDVDY
jgi:hypothetical protein